MYKFNTFFLISLAVLLTIISCSSSNRTTGASQLEGTWELTYMKSSDKTVAELFPEKKPTAVFDMPVTRISGSGGCNLYSGAIKVAGNKIDMSAPIASTKMYCVTGSEGETMYLNNLPLVDNFILVGNDLQFLMGKETVLKYQKTTAASTIQ